MNKVRELGTFVLGLGVITGVLFPYIIGLGRDGFSGGRPAWQFALAAAPGAVLIVTGAIVLVARHSAAVVAALIVVSLLFVVDLLVVPPNLVKLGISGLVLFLVWKTGLQALKETLPPSPLDVAPPAGPVGPARPGRALPHRVSGSGPARFPETSGRARHVGPPPRRSPPNLPPFS